MSSKTRKWRSGLAGSVCAAVVALTLCGCPVPAPVDFSVTPATEQSASGIQSGTFSPANFAYDLTAGSLASWSVLSDAEWLDATPSCGKGNGSVSAHITAAAKALSAGVHTATLTFTSGNDTFTRTVRLTVQADPLAHIRDSFENGQHSTRLGKRYWYEGTEEEPGFYSLTGIPFDELSCKNCHAATYANGTPVNAATYQAGCADCHKDGEKPTQFNVASQAQCFSCHGRQGAEINLSNSPNPTVAARFADVHRSAGMGCADCHLWNEFHGDGERYTSIMDSPSPTCEACHLQGVGGASMPNPAPREHQFHLDSIDCAACHVKTVVSCYNCHFETEVEKDFKRFFGPPPLNGFVMLLNNAKTGKVSTGSFQSVTYQGKKFVAIGPYYGHTVTGAGRVCGDCHNSPNVRTYNETGELHVATWNETAKTITPMTGIIPITEDFQDALKFDFLTYTATDLSPTTPAFQPNLWTLVPGDADLIQMPAVYATPLSASQVHALSLPMPED